MNKKSNKRSAFVFPLHEPHFDFGHNLISSFNKYYEEYKIFVVFSNDLEKESFYLKYPNLSFESLVFPYRIDKGVINKKKYFGINEIFNNYPFEYIGCIDSECLFLKRVDIDKRFSSFYKRGKLFANLISNELTSAVIKSPLKFFSSEQQEKLRVILHAERAYFWFNEIPIYHKETFQNFIRELNIFERFSDITWYDFDFITYAYYCLLHQKLKLIIVIKKINSFGRNGILESQFKIGRFTFNRLLFTIRPNWIKKMGRFYRHPFISFHHDRPEDD